MSNRGLTRNRSANDQCGTILSDTTDETAYFEDTDRDEKTWLKGKVLVGLAPCRLKSAECKKKGRAVPSDLVQTVEFVGDVRYGCCNDCHVQGDKEDGEDEGNDDESEFETVWVVGRCNPCYLLQVLGSLGRGIFCLHIVR